MVWPKITLFGDSLTRRSIDPDNGCWGSYIDYRVGNYFDVDQRGFEGYNTRWALELMPKLFPKSYLENVEIFTLLFGGNDLWESPFMTFVPADEFESNLRAMIKYLTDNGLEERKIIMMTPSWMHEETAEASMRDMGMPPMNISMESFKHYGDISKRVAKDNGIDCVDLFEPTYNHKPLEELFCDGAHYSRKGAKLVFDQLMPVIERKIEAAFGKPIDELWQVPSFDQHPVVKDLFMPYQEKIMEALNKAKDKKQDE